MPNESIYDGPGRLAQPDEVWNFQRGDGVEKAVLLANLLRARHPSANITVRVAPDRAICELDTRRFEFPSTKQLKTQDWPIPMFSEHDSRHRQDSPAHPSLHH
jgi:hypothetical protein